MAMKLLRGGAPAVVALGGAVTLALSRGDALAFLGLLLGVRRQLASAPVRSIRVLDDQIARLRFQLGLRGE